MSLERWIRALFPSLAKRSARAVMSRDSNALRLGTVFCLVIVVCARLSLPLAIEPTDVPLPALDPVRHVAAVQVEAARSAKAKREPLSRDVRSVGEFVRRLGLLEADRAGTAGIDPARASEAVAEHETLQRDATRLCRKLIASDETESLLELRALQTELFTHAVARRDAESHAGELPAELAVELAELGGSFATYLRQLPASTQAPTSELAAAYRARWTQLVGLTDALSFAPSLDDVRQYARLQLRWAATLPPPERARLTRKAIEQLAAADPDYPSEFARGIAEFQSGAYAEAFEHFTRHSRAHADGAWSLRAQNHAQAAAALMLQQQH